VPLPEVLDVTLATGLRVLVARNPSVPMAELRLRVPFGPDATETGGPDSDTAVSRHLAAAELLTATLLTGTATRDRVAIDDELAGVGADLGVSVDPERLQIGGSGLSAGLPTILDVLADVLTGAVHPDAEVVRERSRLVERIIVARAQPRTIAREALQRKRFGTHPIAREMPTARTSPPSSRRTSALCTPRASCRAARSSPSSATSTRTTRSRSWSSASAAGRRRTPRGG
jgi:predicted Zn-dependent peptidase